MHTDGRPIMLRSISTRQGISKKYLDNIFSLLKLAGLIRTVRGASGGYLLARPSSEIQVLEVVRALESTVSPVECTHDAGLCDRTRDCVARQVWQKLEEAMLMVLRNTTLADLVEKQKELDRACEALSGS